MKKVQTEPAMPERERKTVADITAAVLGLEDRDRCFVLGLVEGLGAPCRTGRNA